MVEFGCIGDVVEGIGMGKEIVCGDIEAWGGTWKGGAWEEEGIKGQKWSS